MATLVTRSGKGSPLTHAEVDANFTNLNTDKLELSGGTMTGNLSFGDNDKAIFGAGSDLQIYHDGANSFITDFGTGYLHIRSSTEFKVQNAAGTANHIKAVDSGAVELFYNGSPKLATTSTGIDVTGTVTADGLTVAKGSIGQVASFSGDDVAGARALQVISSTTTNTGDTHSINAQSSTGIVKLSTNNNTQRLAVFPSGDISFYEDTGTTAKFFWDASAEQLNLGGPTSVNAPLNLESNANNKAINIEENGVGTETWQIGVDLDGNLHFYDSNSATPSITFEDGGNVGIGTSSPSAKLSISDAATASTDPTDVTHATISLKYTSTKVLNIGDYSTTPFASYIQSANTSGVPFSLTLNPSGGNVGIGTSSPTSQLNVRGSSTTAAIDVQGTDSTIQGRLYSDNSGQTILYADRLGNAASPALRFYIGTSEHMRIDSSGNLLVGQSSTTTPGTGNTTTGISLRGADGAIHASRNGNRSLYANRSGTDGPIISVEKDGTEVGGIGSYGGTDLTIGTGDTGLRFAAGSDKIWPFNMTTQLNGDAAVTLGDTNKRFKDLYLSGGVYLGGTGAANKLDDYESGTFTVEYYGSGGGTYSKTGYYRKVGSLVTIKVDFYNQNISSLSGTIGVRGLPFTSFSSEGQVGGTFMYSGSTFDGTVYIGASKTDFELYHANTSGPNIDKLEVGDFASSSQASLWLSASYISSA